MEKFGKIIAPGSIQFERLLPGPIERIWAYLTESEKRGQWLASGNMDLVPGGKTELNFQHKDLCKQDDPIPEKYKEFEDGTSSFGKIIRCEPPTLLSYTWDEGSGVISEVSFELIPKGEKVLLILTHSHLGDNRDMIVGVGSGWHTHLSVLEARLNNREPDGFWKVHMQMEAKYDKMIP